MLFSSLFGKKSDYPSEYKRFKKSMALNPGDHNLKAQFIKFCLLNRFSGQEIVKDHMVEALGLFETIAHEDAFDLQCHYLAGKYYQEAKDIRKAYQVYLNAIRRFNLQVGNNPELKSENVELAYSISLNLMTMQSNPVDPELEKCFKNIRKSYPLHLKRVELENEMAKPAPDQDRVKQLAGEIRRLKAEEDKETPAPVAERIVVSSSPKPIESPKAEEKHKPEEKKDIFSKLLSGAIPVAADAAGEPKTELGKLSVTVEKEEILDFLKLSPVSEASHRGFTFMVYENNHWEGPYTSPQLLSMGILKPTSWVCRAGSHQVMQAYEVPDLMSLFQPKV